MFTKSKYISPNTSLNKSETCNSPPDDNLNVVHFRRLEHDLPRQVAGIVPSLPK